MSDEESSHVPLNQFNASELEELASKQYVPEPYKPAVTRKTLDRMANGMTFFDFLPIELERVAKRSTRPSGSSNNVLSAAGEPSEPTDTAQGVPGLVASARHEEGQPPASDPVSAAVEPTGTAQNVQDVEGPAQQGAPPATEEPIAPNDGSAAVEPTLATPLYRFASRTALETENKAFLTIDYYQYEVEAPNRFIGYDKLVLPFHVQAKSCVCDFANDLAFRLMDLNKEGLRRQTEADRSVVVHQHTYVDFPEEDLRNMYANDSSHNRCRMTCIRDFFTTRELEDAKLIGKHVKLPMVMVLETRGLRDGATFYVACDRRICTTLMSVDLEKDGIEFDSTASDQGIPLSVAFGPQPDIVDDAASNQPLTQPLGADLFSRAVEKLMSSAGALPNQPFFPDTIGLTFNSFTNQGENAARPQYSHLLLVVRLVNHLQSSDLSDVKVPTSMVIKMDKPKQKVSKMVVRTIKEGLRREALRQSSDWNLSLLFSDGNKELWDLDLWAMPNKLEGNQLYWVGKQSVLKFIENDTITDGAVEMYLEAHLVPVRKRKAAGSMGP